MGRVFFKKRKRQNLQEEDRICVALMGLAGRKSTDLHARGRILRECIVA